MTEQALKQIEEKHHTIVDADGETCAVCPWEHPPPCDLLKLARALSRAIAALPDNAGHTDCDCARCDGERTLEEVAGEEDVEQCPECGAELGSESHVHYYD